MWFIKLLVELEAGVFNEAKSINETRNEDEEVRVLGVDRDQTEEGKYKSKDGKESNFVLASSLKQVGKTVQDVANQTAKGNSQAVNYNSV